MSTADPGDVLCPQCGYILRNYEPDRRCSECGFAAPDARLVIRAWRERPSPWLVLTLAAVLALMLGTAILRGEMPVWYWWGFLAAVSFALWKAVQRLQRQQRGEAEAHLLVTDETIILVAPEFRRPLPTRDLGDLDIQPRNRSRLHLARPIEVNELVTYDKLWLDGEPALIERFDEERQRLASTAGASDG